MQDASSRDSAPSPRLLEDVDRLRAFDLDALEPREMPTAALMCSPEYFAVEHEINHFMYGNVGATDRGLAQKQWEAMYAALSGLCPVEVIEGVPGLPDMVFAANAALTIKDGDRKSCIISRMMHPSRSEEPIYYGNFFRQLGYEVLTLPGEEPFEGQGDALWHPRKKLLWGGYGHRSTKKAQEEISALLQVPVIPIELVSKEFYHLDTCLCPIDEETVLYCPYAFSPTGNALIEQMFPRRISATKEEAETFVCNSVVVGKKMIIPQGVVRVRAELEAFGYEVTWIDLSEYNKSGGAARCLVLDLY